MVGNVLRRLCVTVCLLVATNGVDITRANDPTAHALLVGVSYYPNLARRFELQGPENDVRLMEELLRDRFSFSSERIVTLSEESGRSDAALLPTRSNIEREFLRLTEVAQRGDEVVIFMAGHGAQQPEQEGMDSEIDGLDEIFLPRDVKQWQPERSVLPNAIVDNEIAAWLKAIQAKGAHLWVIFDCCHSGDMTRGLKGRERFVDASDQEGLAIPAEAIRAARRIAMGRDAGVTERTRGEEKPPPPLDLSNLDNLAVFYACQSHEKAIELPFVAKPEERHFGLLTYSLKAVLSKAKRPLSYRELSRQIYREYVAAGRVSGPTPLVEGVDIDRAVLGNETFERSKIHVSLDPDDVARRALRIDAGQLHGITLNSVLAVFSLLDDDETSPRGKTVLGHVRVTDLDIASAAVIPCEFGEVSKKSPSALAGGRCEVIEVDYGDLRLPVFVDGKDSVGKPLPEDVRNRLETLVGDLAGQKGALVTLAADPTVARWFVRMQNDAVVLVSPQQAIRQAAEPSIAAESKVLGPFKLDEGLAETLGSSLTRIARVENLMRLVSSSDGADGAKRDAAHPEIKIEGHIRAGDKISRAEQLPWVHPGDVIDIRVTNAGHKDLDLTVLYVNSQMGIAPLYPNQNDVINRIRPGQSTKRLLTEFTAGPYGRGHFVFIALAAEGQPTDLNWLAQDTLPRARNRRSPLDTLLENALFGKGKTRSTTSKTCYCFDVLSVEVRPRQ